jgi:hypothetical protein
LQLQLEQLYLTHLIQGIRIMRIKAVQHEAQIALRLAQRYQLT